MRAPLEGDVGARPAFSTSAGRIFSVTQCRRPTTLRSVQRRNDSELIPSSRATSVTVRPDDRTSSTASRLHSAEYRFVDLLPTWHCFLWALTSQSPGVHDQRETSVTLTCHPAQMERLDRACGSADDQGRRELADVERYVCLRNPIVAVSPEPSRATVSRLSASLLPVRRLPTARSIAAPNLKRLAPSGTVPGPCGRPQSDPGA